MGVRGSSTRRQLLLMEAMKSKNRNETWPRSTSGELNLIPRATSLRSFLITGQDNKKEIESKEFTRSNYSTQPHNIEEFSRGFSVARGVSHP